MFRKEHRVARRARRTRRAATAKKKRDAASGETATTRLAAETEDEEAVPGNNLFPAPHNASAMRQTLMDSYFSVLNHELKDNLDDNDKEDSTDND